MYCQQVGGTLDISRNKSVEYCNKDVPDTVLHSAHTLDILREKKENQKKMSCCSSFESKKRKTAQSIVQTFSLPTNEPLLFTFPRDAARAFVQVYGAGGSGSIPLNPETENFAGGSGGGAGGYTELNLVLKKDQSFQISVGRGGASVDNTSSDGHAGTESSFVEFGGDVMLVAGGGEGGSAIGADRPGGVGGTASGGTLNFVGGAGEGGGPPNFLPFGRGGAGGGSPLGSQGGFAARFSVDTFAGLFPGQPGTQPGAGGGGGAAIFDHSTGTTFYAASGAGGDGLVRISYQSCVGSQNK